MAIPLLILAVLATVAGFFVFDQVGEALGFAGGIGALVYLDHPHHFTQVDYVFAAGATATAGADGAVGGSGAGVVAQAASVSVRAMGRDQGNCISQDSVTGPGRGRRGPQGWQL